MGVPTVVQWAKDLTAVDCAAEEERVSSPAWHSGLKELVVLQLWLGFNPCPRNFDMLWIWPQKLKKKKKRTKKNPQHNGVVCWHSVLRIWCCHCSGSSCCCGNGSVPGPGTSTCCGRGQQTNKMHYLAVEILIDFMTEVE